MIHWDWVATAVVATVAVTLTFFGVALTLDALSDWYDARSTHRAIERERAEETARLARDEMR